LLPAIPLLAITLIPSLSVDGAVANMNPTADAFATTGR